MCQRTQIPPYKKIARLAMAEHHPEQQTEEDFRESHLRTILKTVSWRIVATTSTVLIAYMVFGDVSNALKVGGIEFFAKMIIFYFHERAWQLAPRGSVRQWFTRDNNKKHTDTKK